jgi:hypothetical protein
MCTKLLQEKESILEMVNDTKKEVDRMVKIAKQKEADLVSKKDLMTLTSVGKQSPTPLNLHDKVVLNVAGTYL